LRRRALVKSVCARLHPEQLLTVSVGLFLEGDTVDPQFPGSGRQGPRDQAKQGALTAPVTALHQRDAGRDFNGQPGEKLHLGVRITKAEAFSGKNDGVLDGHACFRGEPHVMKEFVI
jgi:hypothetical protein